MLESLIVDLRPLRHRDFRLLMAGRGVTFFGAMITFVVVPFQVYDLTESTVAVGALGLVELVSLLGFAFVGGALADARDRRRLVILTEVVQLVCTLALVANALLPDPQLWVIFLLVAIGTGTDAIQRPALEAMLPRLVPVDEVAAAGALRALQMTAAMVLGPAVAGVLLATAGTAATYAIDAATFAVSLACLSAMRAMPPPDDAERPSIERVREGFRYARSRQDLTGTYVVDFFAMFFGMPMALFPAMAERFGGEAALGVLYAAPAIGSFLATVTSGWITRIHRHGLAITIAAAVWGLGIVGFGFAPSLPVAVAALAIAGGSDLVSALFRGRIWNETVPDSIRGRMAAIEMVSYSSGPTLGNAEAGFAAAALGIRPSIVFGGVACVISVVATALVLPAFLRYDARRFLRSGPGEGEVEGEGEVDGEGERPRELPITEATIAEISVPPGA